MQSIVANQPPLNDLYNLIKKVPRFPLNNRQLLDFARQIKSPAEVVDFYKSFNEGRIYKSRDELTAISEQVDLMRQDEADMPREIEGPEEY